MLLKGSLISLKKKRIVTGLKEREGMRKREKEGILVFIPLWTKKGESRCHPDQIKRLSWRKWRNEGHTSKMRAFELK